MKQQQHQTAAQQQVLRPAAQARMAEEQQVNDADFDALDDGMDHTGAEGEGGAEGIDVSELCRPRQQPVRGCVVG